MNWIELSFSEGKASRDAPREAALESRGKSPM